jgi:uncharacterized protein (DUF1330 family)
MSKGYWIIRVDITEPEAFKAYASSNAEALKKFGAKFLVRAGTFSALRLLHPLPLRAPA